MAAPSPIATPKIFDRRLLRARKARSLRGGTGDFLLARAAADLVDRLAPVQRSFGSVLECSGGGSAVAEALAGTLPAAASLIRLVPTLAGAAAPQPAVVGDPEALPFATGVFDLVVSALELQGVNDLPGALVQIRRALKPDGLFLGCLFGGQTLHEMRAVFTAADIEASGGASPRVAPFADLRDLGGLLQRAGFALPVTDTETVTVRYASLFGLMADLRAMGITNALVERRRRPTTRTLMLRAAQLYAERHADADGRIRATFEIIWLSGWTPHPSQQRPLAPGSAKMRLADALAAIAKADEET